MRRVITAVALVALIAVPASAQPALNLDFPDLAARADEVVDVTLDASMLKLASKYLSNDDDDGNVREMISGLHGIYVRSYEFSREGEYDRGIASRLKARLGPSWKPLVTVRSRTKENVNIFADMRGDEVAGLVIISAEPRELTVVNINGPIDVDRLSDLEGEFGIPKITKEKKP